MNRDLILAALRERILAFATSRASRDHAEDLTQEVLVVLHDKYPHVKDLTELVPLAFQVLRFKMLDAHRKAFRRGEYNSESIDDVPIADSRQPFTAEKAICTFCILVRFYPLFQSRPII